MTINPTDRVLTIYKLAIKESKMANREFVSINDLVAACCLERSGIASHVLKLNDINVRDVRKLMVKDVPSLISINSIICSDNFVKLISINNEVIFDTNSPTIYVGKEFLNAINKAFEISKEIGNSYVGTEHILLGICAISKIIPDLTEDINSLLEVPSDIVCALNSLKKLSCEERIRLFDKFCSCGNLKPCNCKGLL